MTAQLLTAVVLCCAMMARLKGAHASETHHPIDQDAASTALPGASQTGARLVGGGHDTRNINDPAIRLGRVRSESEESLADGRHDNALRLIDDEQILGTVGSENLESLRNRILDDQRFRALLRKSDAAFAQQKLGRAVNLLRQAADMKPRAGTDDKHGRITNRLVKVESEQRFRHGQTAEARGDLKGARDHYTAAIEATGHVVATESLARIDLAAERRVLVEQGRLAGAQGEHARAIEQLRRAITMGAGVEVSPLLADAKLSLSLAEARRLAEQNDLDAAVDAYTRALRMRPEKSEIRSALVTLRQRQTYAQHLERGDALAADGQHLASKVHYRRARSVMADAQIKQRLEDAEFNSLLTEVRRRLASKDMPGARAMLRTAARTPGGIRQADKVRELEDTIGGGESP